MTENWKRVHDVGRVFHDLSTSEGGEDDYDVLRPTK